MIGEYTSRLETSVPDPDESCHLQQFWGCIDFIMFCNQNLYQKATRPSTFAHAPGNRSSGHLQCRHTGCTGCTGCAGCAVHRVVSHKDFEVKLTMSWLMSTTNLCKESRCLTKMSWHVNQQMSTFFDWSCKMIMRISYLVFPATPISTLENTNHCKEFKLPKEKLESDNPTIYLLHILPCVWASMWCSKRATSWDQPPAVLDIACYLQDGKWNLDLVSFPSNSTLLPKLRNHPF